MSAVLLVLQILFDPAGEPSVVMPVQSGPGLCPGSSQGANSSFTAPTFKLWHQLDIVCRRSFVSRLYVNVQIGAEEVLKPVPVGKGCPVLVMRSNIF